MRLCSAVSTALFLILLPFLSAYQRYANPITIATPTNENVYEFDMDVSRKLTMSFTNPPHGMPVDYNPSRGMWTKRDPDQTVDCFKNYTMNPATNAQDAGFLDDVLVLDGKHKRVISINGVSPGLPIVVPLGAEVLLRVRNNVLMDSLTVHIHGVDKQNMWYTDGVAFVQQCPITSSNYYEYRFIADTVGTHWYHGHMQSDRGEGLIGGFIVVNPNDRSVPAGNNNRVIPSREYSVILQDWATTTAEEGWMHMADHTMKWMYGFDNNDKCWQVTRTNDGGNVGGSVPISAILFNDKGWFNQQDVQTRPQNLPLERFRINLNEPVLFRIVNGGVAQQLMIHVEDHQMVIVAADGEEIVPRPIDRLIIFPGERYDVLVYGLNRPTKRSYKMIAETIQYYKWDWTVIDTFYGMAFLEYSSANLPEDNSMPNLLPTECSPTKRCTVLNCPFENYPSNYNYTCVSYDTLQHPNPQRIDREILQDTPFNGGYEEHFINMHFDSHIDQYMFEYPTGMPFYNTDRMDKISKPCDPVKCPLGADRYDKNCSCFYYKEHKLNNIVQVTIFNMGTGGGFGTGYAHPVHLHGTHFYVMKVGWPSYNASGMIENMNPDINCPNADAECTGAVWRNPSWLNGAVPGMNTVNPTSRDTITLPVGGYITIRFRATNPGWWFAHCHLVMHHMDGTAYAFKIGNDDEIPQPPEDFPHQCGYYSMSKIPPVTTRKKAASAITALFTSFIVICMYVWN